MCDFCIEFKKERTSQTRIVRTRSGIHFFPTVGCFTDGYLLAVPEKCISSAALLDTGARNSLLDEAVSAAEELEPYYGRFVIAEHGSGSSCEVGASCVDHAHLHLIPMAEKCPDVREAFHRTGGIPSLSGTRDAFDEIGARPYVSVSIESGQYEIWFNVEKFQRQYVRRVCAGLLGVEPQYNWRTHPFVDAMLRTKVLCSHALACGNSNKAA